eukprot:669887-Amorphochlora_amoeboformis.AAC.1
MVVGELSALTSLYTGTHLKLRFATRIRSFSSKLTPDLSSGFLLARGCLYEIPPRQFNYSQPWRRLMTEAKERISLPCPPDDNEKALRTYNFVILMIFFMIVLWVVKVLVRVRKILTLHKALTSNLVIRLDGEINPSQHIDAISLSHLQQILNSNLTHTSTHIREISPSAHIDGATLEVA